MSILVDNFAGGGGASTGFRLALGRDVDIAVNHDESAILMHALNHPDTKHYQEDIWQVDPREVCHGEPVELAWFSPDCKHFSKAKGAALVDKKIRGLAWVVLRWAGTVRPSVIIVENVEEFTTWGPVRKGKPIKSKSGQTFRKWVSQLEALGYRVEWRELVAADYGAPTSRKRFYLIARCDGLPIVWPEPTHADPRTLEVASGMKPAWRSAEEIIDWTLPCPSIFASKKEIMDEYGIKAVRPLADNTMKRIACGTDKFTIKTDKPFIVPIGYGDRAGQAPRVQDADRPLSTIVGSNKQFVCKPELAPFIAQQKFQNTAQSIERPLSTVTAVGAHELIVASMQAIGQAGFSNDRSYSCENPVKTIVTKAEQCVTESVLSPFHMHNNENATGTDMREPMNTARTGGGGGQMLISAYLSEYYGNAQDGLPLSTPLHTVTAKDREGLTVAHIQKYYSGGYTGCGSAAREPLGTVTAGLDHNALALAHIAEFKGQDKGQRAAAPLRTITASAGEFGIVRTRIEKYAPDANMKRWPQVRALLNRYCGYTLADDEVLLLAVRGVWYFIADIGLRMLTPRELFDAQGFPHDYKIEFINPHTGKPYTRADQVARCGNSVCPPVAAALIRANAPEPMAGRSAA